MSPRLATASGVWIAILAGAPAAQEPPTAAEEAPLVQALAGELKIWRSGVEKVEAVRETSRVFPRDRLGAAEGAVATMAVDARLLLTIRGVEAGRDNGLAVETSGRKVRIRLYRGSLLVESVETEIAVETPHGKVETRGAPAEGGSMLFLVEATADFTRVVAVDGPVTVTKDLGSLPLESGETARVRRTGPPAKGPPADSDKELAWAAASGSQANLLKNPGFEEGLADWMTAFYRKTRPLTNVEEVAAHYGKRCARIELRDVKMGADTNSNRFCLRQDLGRIAKPGQRCFLRFWLKTQDYREEGKTGQVMVSISSEGQRTFFGKCPTAEKTWKCARFFFESKGEDVTLDIGWGDQVVQSGTVWVDDVCLAVLAGDPPKGQAK